MTYVEQLLLKHTQDYVDFKNKLFIEAANAWDPENEECKKYSNILEYARSASKSSSLEYKRLKALVGQYTLLNDIRTGKAKVIDSETNEPVEISFTSIDEA